MTQGQLITWDVDGRPVVSQKPIIGFIEGDGIGPDIWRAAQTVFDAAVAHTYRGERQIIWQELLAGEKAMAQLGADQLLPEQTVTEIARLGVAIKGPLTTPVGKGFRSINVALRHRLDLYACIRPVRYFNRVPAPVISPEKVDVVIFRENTEDLYAGVEWAAGSDDAEDVIRFINDKRTAANATTIDAGSAIGIKPMSQAKSGRLIRMAIQYALEHHLPSVTLVHKGNIMKFTEGAFRDWGYQLAKSEFGEQTITETELYDTYDGKCPEGKVVLKDRIADAMFQQLLLRPDEYDVIATPNLNGDYLSDAVAAQVGGLGMAPGANIGDRCALFEATHGSAPKYAGKDKVNPSSVILSGVEMFRFLGWSEVADAVVGAITQTIEQGTVTYDLARQVQTATEVSCSAFGHAIVKNLK